jgi:hypothetical protein
MRGPFRSHRRRQCVCTLVLVIAILNASCGVKVAGNVSGGSTTLAASQTTSCSNAPACPTALNGANNIQVQWSASSESAVNSTGGGYKVYYSTCTDFTVTEACGNVDVPFVSGSAPTSKQINGFPNGTYYFKVVSYSTTTGTTSSLSSAVTVAVP